MMKRISPQEPPRAPKSPQEPPRAPKSPPKIIFIHFWSEIFRNKKNLFFIF
jgi:hypothetical protein